MSNFKKQYPRLQFIDKKISENIYPNCKTLAKEYEVSAKTMERDLDFIRNEFGAPVAYDSSKKGYYYTEPNYRIPWIHITESDLFAICIADRALAAYKNTPIYEKLTDIFTKIKNSLPERIKMSTSWLGDHYSFLEEPHTKINPEIWETISKSIQINKELRIHHKKATEKKTDMRTVHPYHIINYSGEWYLVAMCTKRNEMRRFAVSRINKAEVMKKSYTVDTEFDIKEYMGNSFSIFYQEKEFDVKIEFSKQIAPYIEERTWHPEQTIKEYKNGKIILSMKCTSKLEIKRWILSWGSDAKTVSPDWLKQDIKEEAIKIINS